ncbi:stress responsive A/B barrel domain-containing protein [Paramyrothecium foliicola]|nr:stress responsive A/B barrel domain-containing protein [Paramyrothecium foliicola]
MRSHWPATLGTAAVFLVFIVIVAFQLSPPLPDALPIKSIMDAHAKCSPSPTPELNPKGTTYLMVLHFKDQAPLTSIYQTANSTIALKQTCLHPITRNPYIRSIRGGKDNIQDPAENTGTGTTHAFIIEFDSPDHRNYFVDFDPAHKAFKLDVEPLLMQSPIIIDFTTGLY